MESDFDTECSLLENSHAYLGEDEHVNMPKITILHIIMFLLPLRTDENVFEFVGLVDEHDGVVHDDDLTTTSALTCESLVTMKSDSQKEGGKGKVADTKDIHSLVSLPKIVNNDARRSFSKMYMGMINGGDFQQVQDFSRTFIRPDAVFAARIQCNSEYQLPSFLHGWGSRAHVHYMIGIYVMYPDVAATFGETQLITSNQWPGTKVIIPWQCKMTKTYHIPVECWIPAENVTEKMYAEPSIEKMMEVLSVQGTAASEKEANGTGDIAANVMKPKKKRKRSLNIATFQQNRSAPVPLQFVQNLQNSAAVCPPTAQLIAEGTYTIMLDENHRIASIALEVTQAEGTK